MTDLEKAVENGKPLGKLALYFGCWDSAGHCLYAPGGRSVWSATRPADLPWGDALMDSGLLHNRKVPDNPDGGVHWTVGGKDAFWYAFFWWDRSVDRRGACNSGFYVRGFGFPEAKDAFAYACSKFPHVVARQIYPLTLQNTEQQDLKAHP